MRNWIAASLLAAGALPLDSARGAQEPAGPLAGLPGAPGAHLAKIRELPEGGWLELGPPAPDPTWGRARGRSWTSEMPFAPELGGAFLFGEGVHGYAKPDGRYMDDLWFYDLRAHRWICVYPGADTKTLDLKIDADGFEAAADGERLPVASQVHGYEMNTYDPDLRRFMSMPNLHGYEKRALPQRDRWARPAPADASPWFYETRKGRWNRVRTGSDGPKSGFGDTLIYLSPMKKAFFAHRSSEVWFYDTRENKWSKANPEGPKPPFGIDAVSCHDPKRERIYIGGGSYPVAPAETHAFWIYDLKADAWVDPKPKGKPVRGSNSYPTKNAVLVYEPRSDLVLLVMHSHADDKAERLGVWVYDPQANAWADEPIALPEKLARDRRPKNGFHDPELGAVFIHSAGDSQDDGTIWAFRPKSRGK